MFISMQRVHVHPDYTAAFEEKFVQRPRRVDRFIGFVRNEVLRPLTAGGPYVVITHWRDRGGFDAWEADRVNHTRKHPLPREAYQGMATECYEAVWQLDVQPVALSSVYASERYMASPALQLEENLAQTAATVEGQANLQRLEVLRPTQTDGAYLRLSCWNSRNDAEAWLASLPAAEALSGGSDSRVDIELHELILSSDFGG